MTVLWFEAGASRDIIVKAILIGVTLLGAATVGVLQPSVSLLYLVFLAALLLIPVALSLDAERLILGALGIVMFSRLLVALGAPSLLNYAHFGVALIALMKLVERRQSGIGSVAFDAGLIGLTLVTIASAVGNGLFGLRPALFWLSITEPFLFLALMTGMEEASRKRLRGFILAFAIIQLPFAGLQFLMHGIGDDVKGTLVGQGAGHHILGAICVIAGVVIIARARRKGHLDLILWVLAGVLLSVGIFSDAKQVYSALALAAIPFAPSLFRLRVASLLPLGVLLAVVMVGGAQFYSPLARTFDVDVVRETAERKLDQNLDVASEIGWGGSFLGLGPGNGLSRVALTTVPGYGHVPPGILGEDQPAHLASVTLASYPATRLSSASSPFSSWLGIYTDVGVLGLLMYIVLGLWAWNTLARSRPNDRDMGRLLLLLAVVLGFVFLWLDEASFMIYLAVAIGTYLPQRHAEQSTHSES